MSFDTYSGPSPWESTNNKKNPFDTEETGIVQNTSTFDTDKNKGTNQDTSIFNTKKESSGKLQDTSIFDTEKSIKNDKGFISYNPEGLISTRKHNKKINKIVKKHLIKKYKLTKKRDAEILDLVIDIEGGNNSKKNIIHKKGKENDEDIVIDFKKDLKQKKQILEKDKEYNLDIKILQQQGKTKEQILKIINEKLIV